MYTLRMVRPSSPWKQLHQFQLTTILFFLVFVPIGKLVIAEWGYNALLPFAAIFGGALLFLQDRAINWRCPRCSKPFLRKNGKDFALPFRRFCGSCGLRHGASTKEINE